MIFLRDNFAKDHGNFVNETAECAIDYFGGSKRFIKPTASWDKGGHRTVVPRLIQPGDTWTQVFSIPNFIPGNVNSDNSNVMFMFRWQTPGANILDSSGWGLYIRPDGAVTMSVNEPSQGPIVPFEANVRYTSQFYFDESGLTMRIWGGQIPFATKVGHIASTGIVGSNAWFYLNIYSATTVRLFDLIAYDAAGI
jgi:hypothetical protein